MPPADSPHPVHSPIVAANPPTVDPYFGTHSQAGPPTTDFAQQNPPPSHPTHSPTVAATHRPTHH